MTMIRLLVMIPRLGPALGMGAYHHRAPWNKQTRARQYMSYAEYALTTLLIKIYANKICN
jgi:hypothetical protein